MMDRLLNALGILVRLVRRPAGLLFAGILLIFGLAFADSHDAATNLVYRVFVAREVSVPVAECLHLFLGVSAIAGAQVVFMRLVADELYPEAPMAITDGMKLAACAVAWGGLVAVTWVWIWIYP